MPLWQDSQFARDRSLTLGVNLLHPYNAKNSHITIVFFPNGVYHAGLECCNTMWGNDLANTVDSWHGLCMLVWHVTATHMGGTRGSHDML